MKGLALAAAVGTTLVVVACSAATPGAHVPQTSSPSPTVETSVAVVGLPTVQRAGSLGAARPTVAVDAPSCDNVAVVVDAGALDTGPLGRASSLACAPVDGTVTVHDAASAAGVELQGTDQWGAAFVCRVDGRPAVDEDVRRADGSVGTESCARTPSQGAYWALWTSTQGSTWVYAVRGATSAEVAPGDAVGLVFVTSDQPGPPQISPSDALGGTAPDGWAVDLESRPGEIGSGDPDLDEAGGSHPTTPPVDGPAADASPPVDAPVGVVALAGLGLALGLLALAALRVRTRRS